MPEETTPSKADDTPPPRPSRSPVSDPAAVFIAAATLFAIIINSQNVGVILMLGVIALLLETRIRPKG
ncbi:MAG TPA: hypothetical protein VFR68_14410 [Candidatus Dormibacteraeota bacterium]|nr:hypothetical protein [Candidatus Dormibacteraeota bacterium]